MNKIDKAIENKAIELFTAQNMPVSLIEFKVKELQICIARGYNTRSEIWRLIKLAEVAA